MSYRPMVRVGNEWAGNGIRFATRAEAEASARDLAMRWTLVLDHRADESDDEVNCGWDPVRGNVHLEVMTCESSAAL
jgi:hypothetical protein